MKTFAYGLLSLLLAFGPHATAADLAVHGDTVYTMAGAPLKDAVVIVQEGKITAIGKADSIKIPDGCQQLSAAFVTPGLIDAHSTVGTSGILNYAHDQDQLEHAQPMQPELRGVDAYNSQDELVAWVRGYGVTTIHTGHAPGELISGQTLVVKTTGMTVEDATLKPACAIAVTLADSARKSNDKSPGTRAKMIAMLRQELIRAQEYQRNREEAASAPSSDEGLDDESVDTAESGNSEAKDDPVDVDLRLETLAKTLNHGLPLLVTVDRAQDISSALRLAKEFQLNVWLDSAAESYLLIDDIKASGAPVIIHPTMARSVGERENASFETAAKLVKAGIPVALQSGYESYVPKTRVVLFEAGMAAANGLSFSEALGTVTIQAAKILGVDDRVGSLEIGKDGDLALYDGDPFEYTTHCVAVVINGEVVSSEPH